MIYNIQYSGGEGGEGVIAAIITWYRIAPSPIRIGDREAVVGSPKLEATTRNSTANEVNPIASYYTCTRHTVGHTEMTLSDTLQNYVVVLIT